ncbi:MAG: hypothetical protein WAZ36_01090 [Sediminibacterium sp.]
MDIWQLTAALNDKARTDGYRIAELPELRKFYLHKKILPDLIFHSRTTKNEKDIYAFHYGGRDEMQFNVGQELIGGREMTRYGLCFSLEGSRSLTDPLGVLNPFRLRANDFIVRFRGSFKKFKLWYFHKGVRYGNYQVQVISDAVFRADTFLCIGEIIPKPISELTEQDLDTILRGFDNLLPLYQYAVLGIDEIRSGPTIFTRLTSNENKWELPSPHRWRKKNQGHGNIAFEHQYGFGHEEWLRNTRYCVDGFQYGFIRGFQHCKKDISYCERVYLYTVKKERNSNLVYYVGYIDSLSVIRAGGTALEEIMPVVETFRDDMLREIEHINGDTAGMTDYPFQPVVRFKPENVHFLEVPVLQPDFDLGTYKRFLAYELDRPIDELFSNIRLEEQTTFIPGKASQTAMFDRENKSGSIVVEKVHVEIVEALEKFLSPRYSLRLRNISIEMMRFAGNIADVVTSETDGSITIYEVKTGASGRRNIRDAVSQLLDYALHAGTVRINKLIMVSPSWLRPDEREFLGALQLQIGFDLEYFSYRQGALVTFVRQDP